MVAEMIAITRTPLSEQESDTFQGVPLGFDTKKNDGWSGMVLSEDEVLDGEVLWRALKCSHPTFASISFITIPSTSNLNHRGTSKKVHRSLHVRESLNSHNRDIYRGYALIRQELSSMYLPPLALLGTVSSRPSYSYLTFIFELPFSLCLLPLGNLYHFRCLLLQKKNFCRIFCSSG